MKTLPLLLLPIALGLTACPPAPPGEDPKDDDDDDGVAVAEAAAKAFIGGELSLLGNSAAALQSFAVDADDNGWNVDNNRASVFTMRQQWKNARLGYERVEGVVGVLFPELDVALDQRHEDAIAVAADDNVFDDVGFTGLHAVGRVLFVDELAPAVLTFEQSAGDAFTPSRYSPPAFPANLTESGDFKTKQTQKLLDDSAALVATLDSADVTLDDVMAGIRASVQQQRVYVDVGADGEDESRYAENTMIDLRAQLQGAIALFDILDPVFVAKDEAAISEEIHAGLARLQVAFDAVSGDALPPVPATWDATAPSAADLVSAFGALFVVVDAEADGTTETSLASALTRAASLLAP